jgi:geranylgeranyl diphosphate synthase type I
MAIDDVKQMIAEHKDLIDTAIVTVIDQRLAEATSISPHLVPVLTAMQELAQGGKRLRGLLTILGYHLAGGQPHDDIYQAAAVMELFHLGLLIHDDIMDRDDLRRGVSAVHTRYDDRHLGESIAICAGDFTFAWGLDIVARLKFDIAHLNSATRVWAKYFARVGYGQILDVIGEQRGDTSAEEVLQVLHLKSGEYTCVLPLQFGAALAGGDETMMDWLGQYGMELGWVFHLRDDWLGTFGDTTKTGKPVGGDAREGRKSYATLYGKEATEEAISEHWEKGKVLAKKNPVLEGLLEWMATREN